MSILSELKVLNIVQLLRIENELNRGYRNVINKINKSKEQVNGDNLPMAYSRGITKGIYLNQKGLKISLGSKSE